MASFVSYTPSDAIAKAMFNFDAFGLSNFKLTGTVNVSVSDAFTFSQYLAAFPQLSANIYTELSSGNGGWTTDQLSNINLVTRTFSNFINLAFTNTVNYSGFTPANVGNLSDINISLTYRTDWSASGESAIGTDASFGYLGSRGDIVLNVNGFGSFGLLNDYSLSLQSFGGHTLMHEIGHSLGLSHPHNGALLTSDFAATANLGFDLLGFQIDSASDMNKEYFSVMSYDDQDPWFSRDTFAQTPMILDIIALQSAYGAGSGSSGSGNDTITPGALGGVDSYRTYFDTGGADTVDLTNYASGAYLHMGNEITGAAHLVGVSMSVLDASLMFSGSDPQSLRWFYGEYENAIGSSSGDLIFGNSMNNAIASGQGDDSIYGGAGNDTLDGGFGFDLLNGGDGIDTSTYAFYSGSIRANLATGVVEFPGDSFQVDTLVSIENLVGADGNDTLSGGDTTNRLLGGTGADSLFGSLGNDSLFGESGNDSLSGGDGADLLVGGDGNDFLDWDSQRLGNDTMLGGAGNDVYVISGTDVVVENSGEGVDFIWADQSYSLASLEFVENLSLFGTLDASATGNAFGNILVGNTGNNVLDGGAGADTMSGGLGNDTYFVEDAGDVIIESANVLNGGIDLVRSSVTRTLGAYQENLVLSSALAINGTGNGLANKLTGNEAANVLTGGGGNDVLDGLGGVDTLIGGAGDDYYVVDLVANGSGGFVLQDVLKESAGAGNDTVEVVAAGVTIAVPTTLVLSANFENLLLYDGVGAPNDVAWLLNGTGNGLDNRITGNAAANVLSGGAGNDTLAGAGGNDTYVVSEAGDKVVELTGEGADLVKSSVTHTLAANVEKLQLTGSGAINGTGNSQANMLTGNSGANTLGGGGGNDLIYGKGGADTLTGGGGADKFYFDTALDAGNVDLLTDFATAANDKIVLDKTIFGTVGPVGALATSNFALGPAATTAAQRIIYNSGTGALYYDADGSGVGAKVQFATLGATTHPLIAAADFQVVA